MSTTNTWPEISTAIEAAVRTAIPTLPAGDLGYEWGQRSPQELGSNEFPHVFLHTITQGTDKLILQQRQHITIASMDYWRKDRDTAQLALDINAITAELELMVLDDPESVIFVSARGMTVHPSEPMSVGSISVDIEWGEL